MVNVDPIAASEVSTFLGVPLQGTDMLIRRICPARSLEPGALAFFQVAGTDLLEAANRIGDVFVLAPLGAAGELCCTHVLVGDPRLAYARVVTRFFEGRPLPAIAPSAVIHPSAVVGRRVAIGNGTVIDEDVEIQDDTFIGDHVVIRRNTRIGRRCVLLSHVVIGEAGLGFDFDCKVPIRIPQIGGVRIGDDVQINCRSSIDRGTLENTIIEDHVKISSQVHIAHNCRVGRGTLVAGGVSLCGAVRVGQFAWIGTGAVVREGGVTIGDDAMVGLGAVVIRPVLPREVVVGNPARVLRVRAPNEEF